MRLAMKEKRSSARTARMNATNRAHTKWGETYADGLLLTTNVASRRSRPPRSRGASPGQRAVLAMTLRGLLPFSNAASVPAIGSGAYMRAGASSGRELTPEVGATPEGPGWSCTQPTMDSLELPARPYSHEITSSSPATPDISGRVVRKLGFRRPTLMDFLRGKHDGLGPDLARSKSRLSVAQ